MKKLLIVLLISLSSCSNDDDGIVERNGTIVTESCRTIVDFGSSKYQPTSLAEEFRVNGLRVRVRFQRTGEIGSCSGFLESLENIDILNMELIN